MNTPTHILIGAGLLTRPGDRYVNIAAVLGGLTPDIPMFVMFGWSRFVLGLSDSQVWGEVYWRESWQTAVAGSHSFPLHLALLLIAHFLRMRWLSVYAMAVLLHAAVDFPVHREDAHAQFWPLTNWKFISPVSYWDRNHYGSIVGTIEVGIAIVMIIVLWRRFNLIIWTRALLSLALISYVALPIYFSTMPRQHGPSMAPQGTNIPQHQ